MDNMNEKTHEIMNIAQEEAAEVIQIISKIRRFGLHAEFRGTVNRDALEQECGDMLAMIDLLKQQGILSETGLKEASERKVAKLQQWSNIFNK
jgi:NTP pyrophosphatase (non-canonical NTP hydrolase)